MKKADHALGATDSKIPSRKLKKTMARVYGKLKQRAISVYVTEKQFEQLQRLRAVAYPESHRNMATFIRYIIGEFIIQHMWRVYTHKKPPEVETAVVGVPDDKRRIPETF